MKISVGLPVDCGFRFTGSTLNKDAVESILCSGRIRQIGSNVDIEVREGVFIRMDYVEDYNDKSSFYEYRQRAEMYAQSLIDDLRKAQ